jgi:hypothetical protein
MVWKPSELIAAPYGEGYARATVNGASFVIRPVSSASLWRMVSRSRDTWLL